ncbi:nuclear transport factor 2 family protein [Aquibaculum sediminis]|uniref:nuclear transport factor 2 family protein n=1 Tax=Aquibaculum sediminis TaxID=3231907 RepID=UPI003454218A
MADEMIKLLAREEIRELIKRWCRAIDRLDLEAIRDVFHPDAYDDHGSFKGGVDALIAWIAERHSSIPFSMHAVTNCLVDFLAEDEALAETYCIAMQKYPVESRGALESLVGELDMPADKALDMTIACRYVDIVTRRDGCWKIARRTVVFDSVSVVPGVAIPRPEDTGWVGGKRGGEGADRDLVHQILARGTA